MSKSCKQHKERKCINSRVNRLLILSIFLLGAGTILILGNMGIIDKTIFHYIFSWQSLLIAFGVFLLVGGIRSHWFASFVLISIGTLFLIDEIYALKTGATNIIWPLLLIILGVAIIIKVLIPKKKRKRTDGDIESYSGGNGLSEEFSSDDYINISKVFSGTNIIIRSENFQGGKASYVFGGGEIDLRNAKLADGTFILKIECVFGGVKIYVPKEWDVNIESSGVFGGFSDERRYVSINEIDKTRKLIIKAEAVFGGGEISN